MIDINIKAQKALEALPYTITFSMPEKWNKLPVISFYDINTAESFSADNGTQIYIGRIVVDVWTKTPANGATVAMEVINQMETDGWWCELNRFADKTDGVYHRTLRFGKNFINNESEESL